MNLFLLIDTALCGIATILDITSTDAAIAAGAVEGDRVYRAAGENWRFVRIVVSIAMVVLMWLAAGSTETPWRWVPVATVIAWSGYVWVVARRNWRLAR